MFPQDTNRGFSLLETLIAAAILVTVLGSLAPLVGWSVSHARSAGARSQSLLLAQEKLERFRAMAWTVDALGIAVSDAELAPTPSGSLDVNTPGSVDGVDAQGRQVNEANAVAIRRWAVTALDASGPDAVAITVCAFKASATGVPRAGADACVSTVRVRQP